MFLEIYKFMQILSFLLWKTQKLVSPKFVSVATSCLSTITTTITTYWLFRGFKDLKNAQVNSSVEPGPRTSNDGKKGRSQWKERKTRKERQENGSGATGKKFLIWTIQTRLVSLDYLDWTTYISLLSLDYLDWTTSDMLDGPDHV